MLVQGQEIGRLAEEQRGSSDTAWELRHLALAPSDSHAQEGGEIIATERGKKKRGAPHCVRPHGRPRLNCGSQRGGQGLTQLAVRRLGWTERQWRSLSSRGGGGRAEQRRCRERSPRRVSAVRQRQQQVVHRLARAVQVRVQSRIQQRVEWARAAVALTAAARVVLHRRHSDWLVAEKSGRLVSGRTASGESQTAGTVEQSGLAAAVLHRVVEGALCRFSPSFQLPSSRTQRRPPRTVPFSSDEPSARNIVEFKCVERLPPELLRQ